MECSGTRLSLCSVLVLVSRLEVTLPPYVLFHLFKIPNRPILPSHVYPPYQYQYQDGSDEGNSKSQASSFSTKVGGIHAVCLSYERLRVLEKESQWALSSSEDP